MELKLKKMSPAVRSYANYNSGAKTAKWALIDCASGETKAEIRGQIRGRQTSFEAFLMTGKPIPGCYGKRDDVVKEAIAFFNSQQQ